MIPASDTITCPFCNAEGWPSVRMFAMFASNCGTAWGDDGYVSQSPECVRSMRREIELALLKMGVAS